MAKSVCATMGLDAAVSIQAKNSPEKMLAHQLAAVHRVVMDHMAFSPSRLDLAGGSFIASATI